MEGMSCQPCLVCVSFQCLLVALVGRSWLAAVLAGSGFFCECFSVSSEAEFKGHRPEAWCPATSGQLLRQRQLCRRRRCGVPTQIAVLSSCEVRSRVFAHIEQEATLHHPVLGAMLTVCAEEHAACIVDKLRGPVSALPKEVDEIVVTLHFPTWHFPALGEVLTVLAQEHVVSCSCQS